MKMTSISWIWIIFTLIFLGLSCIHFIQTWRKIEHFPKAYEISPGVFLVKGKPIDKPHPLNDFAEDINSYIDKYNISASWQNRIAAFGYLIAAFIAFFSMFLEIKSKTLRL